MLYDLKRDASFHMSRAVANSANGSNSLPSRKEIAMAGELCAMDWFVKQGYAVLERNWHSGRFAEIDLILRSKEGLFVFVEVKSRWRGAAKPGFDNCGFDSITWNKRRKILVAAQAYLARTHVREPNSRCDAVLVTYDKVRWSATELVLSGIDLLHVPAAFSTW